MRERQRQEVLDDLIQVTLFDAVLIGWLRLDILQLQGEARMGFVFFLKSMGFVGE